MSRLSTMFKRMRGRHHRQRMAIYREDKDWYAPTMLKREQNQRLHDEDGDLHPLLEKPDITQELFTDIKDRLDHNGFVKILIVGDNNTGKSRLNELLSHYTALCSRGREFTIEFPDEAPARIKPFIQQPMRGAVLITSDTSETLATIKLHAHPGDCISQDEDLALDGADSKLVLSRARSLFKAGRAYQVPYVVATPQLHNNLVMFDWILHTYRINYKLRRTRCYVLSGRRHELMGWAEFAILPTGDNYRPWIRQKWATLSDLFDDQGSRSVARVIRLDDAKRIKTYAKSKAEELRIPLATFRVFRLIARTTRIAGGSEEQDDLIHLAHELYKAEKDLESAFRSSQPRSAPSEGVAHMDFLTVLQAYARAILRPLVKKPIVVERWILRYFKGLTWKAIQEEHGERRDDTVRKSIMDKRDGLDAKLSKTLKARILEEATCVYLNAHTLPTPISAPSSTDLPRAPVWRVSGGPDAPDVFLGSNPSAPIAAINCKLLFGHRAAWTVKPVPESELAPPDRAWVLLTELGPPTGAQGPRIIPVPNNAQHISTGSVEEVKFGDWLEELRGIIKESQEDMK